MSRRLRPVMCLHLDKVVAPDTHFSGSSDEPSPFVNIEFQQTFVSHFQEEGLANFLVHDIGAFHDLVDFERLLAERAEDIFSIIQHALVSSRCRSEDYWDRCSSIVLSCNGITKTHELHQFLRV